MGPFLSAVRWLAAKLFDWVVVGIGAPVIYGLGVDALYGDEYWTAACVFVVAVTWLTAKVVLCGEVTNHEHKGWVRFAVIYIAVAVLVGSGFLIRQRRVHLDEAEQSKKAVPPNALAFRALSVGIRNEPERAQATTWDGKPWNEDLYADVRLSIENVFEYPVQDIDLDINVADGNQKAQIGAIGQLTDEVVWNFVDPKYRRWY